MYFIDYVFPYSQIAVISVLYPIYWMPHQENILLLKQAIKVWEHEFQRSNNRIPSRLDIKLDPKIYKLYKTYKTLKSKQTGDKENVLDHKTEEPEDKKTGIDINILESQSDIEDLEEENEGTRSTDIQLKSSNAELGPTPQANGKVLSILDMRLTPPDSSPLKTKLHSKVPEIPATLVDQASQDTFKTPTKSRVSRIDLLDLTSSNTKKSNGNALFLKLEQIANMKGDDSISNQVKIRTPNNKGDNLLKSLETPQYLAKVNNKFNFDMDLDNKINDHSGSPLKVNETLVMSASNYTEPNTPTRAPSSINFQVSPSPLKPHRLFSFGNNKKLSEIFNDYKNIKEDSELQDESNNNEEETAFENGAETGKESSERDRKRKRKTQKRTTRRWKIKPTTNNVEEDTLKDINIHDEVKRLDDEAHKNLVQYMDDENLVSESNEEQSGDEYVHQDPNDKSMKGKFKPVRMNYQRLKINDPRTKKFKRRMQNRR